MTASIPISNRLLNTRLVAGGMRDAEMVRAYETGQAITRRAAEGLAGAVGRYISRFIPRGPKVHPVSPDKAASRQRKRKWGGSSAMPDELRSCYPEGQRAVLAVVAQEVKRQGYCDLTINRIAAIAGVSRSTVQNALRAASSKELAHVSIEARPQTGRKNLSNVIRIVSRSWMGWIKRSIGFKSKHPSEIKGDNISTVRTEAPLQGAFERERAAIASPKMEKVTGADVFDSRLANLPVCPSQPNSIPPIGRITLANNANRVCRGGGLELSTR